MRSKFSRDDIEALRALEKETEAEQFPQNDGEQTFKRGILALLRVVAGLAEIQLDREAAECNAATEALR